MGWMYASESPCPFYCPNAFFFLDETDAHHVRCKIAHIEFGVWRCLIERNPVWVRRVGFAFVGNHLSPLRHEQSSN